jgi:hypothetical protein
MQVFRCSGRPTTIALLLGLCAASTASADEHALLPPTEINYQASASSPWQKWFANTIGKSWDKPVNYVDGKMHMRCFARTLTRPTELQVCIYWDGKKGKHSCAKRLRLESTGDLATVSSTPTQWWCSEPQNWANIGPKFRILMRDGLALSKLSNWKTYFPLKVNCTVVMVSKGATFSGWSNYPFADMPGAPPDAGASDAGGEMLADGVPADAAPSALPTVPDGGVPGHDGVTVPAAQISPRDRAQEGCACSATTGTAPATTLALLLLLLLAWEACRRPPDALG